jgi:hypothetical protein
MTIDRTGVCCAVLGLGMILVLVLLAPPPSHAEETRWESVGVRGGANGDRVVLGARETESFQQYELAATLGLPWSLYSESGWGVGTKLMTSFGALTGAGDTAILATLVPALTFGLRDSLLAVDVGVGGALLSRHEFGRQDLGGPFQFVFTVGITVPIYRSLGIGYRLHHISDAGIYGDGQGVDVHLLELTYRFR